MTDFYKQLSEDVIHELDSNIDTGLSSDNVTQRQEEHGLNELEESKQRSVGEILLENLNNMIVYLLGFAALLSMFMGDWVEAVAILIAVLIAVLTVFFAEYSAQKSVEALQDVVDTIARVLRDGKEQELPANEIVPGDILLLNEGDAIAADGRLISTNNLAVITRGKGKAIVIETGMETEVGKISGMIDDDESEDSPLDEEIDQLGKVLIMVAFFAALLVFVIGLFQGQDIPELLQIAVILAVAAISEALPAVETISSSNGMNTMAEHRALVKTLSAVETLGSTSVIASDKTGTLTENQMTVQNVILKTGDEFNLFDISGNGYTPEGEIHRGE